MSPRWTDYVYADGERLTAADLLTAGTPDRGRAAYVLGVGFDPRCLVGLSTFLNLDHRSSPIVVRIELPPRTPSVQPASVSLAEEHLAQFEAATSTIDVRTIRYPSVESPYSAGNVIAREMTAADNLEGIGQLIVDVSSLPSTLYFPVLKAGLTAHGLSETIRGSYAGELQVIACENPRLDRAILDLGVSTAEFVGGFKSYYHRAGESRGTTVWIPVIGENADAALRAVHDLLEPDDICPVLPFPARDPRRADALVLEHRTVLFDAFQVRVADLVYADERNPFDLYETLYELDRDYKAALTSLGSTVVAVSSHGSKLLSLGVLLAAFECEMPIVAAFATEYEIDDMIDLEEVRADNRLSCLWLAGEPYG